MRVLIAVIVLINISLKSTAQSGKYEVHLEQNHVFNDSLAAISFLQNHLLYLMENGYLLAEINYDQQIFTIEKGMQFRWASLSKGNLPSEYLGEYGFEQNFDNGNPFSARQVSRLLNGIITKAENKGYPFARIKLDSIRINENQIYAGIYYESGPLIVFDSIKITGTSKLNKKWLGAYLNIQQGATFNEKSYRQVVEQLENFPFIQITSPPEITFQNEEAAVQIYLKDVPSNKFDAVIGFAPQQGSGKKLLLSGQVNVELQNLFRRGHNFSLGWRSVKPETQELQAKYFIPNIFNSPISVNGSAELYKQDSTFFNNEWVLGLSVRKNRWNFGGYSKFFSSSSQEVQENGITDVKVNSAGLTASHFSKGKTSIRFSALIGAGNRQAESSSGKYENLQSEIQLNGQIQFRNDRNGFVEIEPSVHGVFSEGLLVNDMVRIGGIKSMRGFPENFFFTQRYGLMRSEYHWLFDEESSFFALFDAAFMSGNNIDYAYGAGLGFDLKVNSGIFELIYAVGGHEAEAISFDRSVIHFGYKAVF